MISLSAEGVTEMVGWAVDKALQEFATKQTRDVSTGSARNGRDEMEKTVKDMQAQVTQMMSELMATTRAEAETRANAMLQTLLERMPGMILGSVANKSETIDKPGQAALQNVGTKTQSNSQIPLVAKQTWAHRFGTGIQVTNDWTTVSGRRKPTNAKKVLKKHPADQRRVLLLRRSSTQQRDPRDIMLAVNKALAQEGADSTVRMVGLRYKKRGNLSGSTVEHARADDTKPRGSGRKEKEGFVRIAADMTTSASASKQPDVASAPRTTQGPNIVVRLRTAERGRCRVGTKLQNVQTVEVDTWRHPQDA
jgi:hypothetical protein